MSFEQEEETDIRYCHPLAIARGDRSAKNIQGTKSIVHGIGRKAFSFFKSIRTFLHQLVIQVIVLNPDSAGDRCRFGTCLTILVEE